MATQAAIQFAQPPRLRGDFSVDLGNMIDWLWDFYKVAILSRGLVQSADFNDPELLALSALESAADTLPYFTGEGEASLAAFGAYARSLLALTSSSELRDLLTLGVFATATAAAAQELLTRVTAAADSTAITPAINTSDTTTQANTQAAGTLTINTPSGTPYSGQKHIFRIKSTNAQAFSWNAVYRGGDIPLPANTSGSGKTDYLGFIYNAADSRWDLVARSTGY